VAETLNLSPDETLKKFPNMKLVDDIPEYSPRKDIKVEGMPSTKEMQTQKVILPQAVRAYAENRGISPEEAAQEFRDQGYEIRKDPFLKKLKKKRAS
jgi:hypothetical protein